MSVTRNDPNTIFLGGDRTQINDLAAGAAITPGHQIERYNTAGVIRWRKAATAGGANAPILATEQTMQNLGIADDYAAGDLVEASVLHKGAAGWAWIPSGETIVAGDKLEQGATAGTLRKLASGVAIYSALENKTVLALTRIRVEAL